MVKAQMILIALYAMSLGLSLERHGKQRTGKENFWITLLSAAIIFALLIWGGFFS